MPLTKKGAKIMRAMVEEYGAKKGKQVFYSSANAGKITGVHAGKKRKRKGSLHRAMMKSALHM